MRPPAGQCQVLIWRCPRLPAKRSSSTRAVRFLGRSVRISQTPVHRPAQRHTCRPPPLRSQQILPYGLAFDLPRTGSRRDFLRRWFLRAALCTVEGTLETTLTQPGNNHSYHAPNPSEVATSEEKPRAIGASESASVTGASFVHQASAEEILASRPTCAPPAGSRR